MNNREEFEAWAEKELLPLDRRDSEHYRYNLTNRAWAGWKAGLASQAAELSSNPLQLPAQKQQDHIPDGGEMVQSQAQQTESKLDCVKVTTGGHDKFHELLEAILNAGERVAMPVSFLSIINEAGMKFIKLLPPSPEGDKP